VKGTVEQTIKICMDCVDVETASIRTC